MGGGHPVVDQLTQPLFQLILLQLRRCPAVVRAKPSCRTCHVRRGHQLSHSEPGARSGRLSLHGEGSSDR